MVSVGVDSLGRFGKQPRYLEVDVGPSFETASGMRPSSARCIVAGFEPLAFDHAADREGPYSMPLIEEASDQPR